MLREVTKCLGFKSFKIILCCGSKLSHANSENVSEPQTGDWNHNLRVRTQMAKGIFFKFQIIINNQAVRSAQVIIKMILQMPSNKNKQNIV